MALLTMLYSVSLCNRIDHVCVCVFVQPFETNQCPWQTKISAKDLGSNSSPNKVLPQGLPNETSPINVWPKNLAKEKRSANKKKLLIKKKKLSAKKFKFCLQSC